MTFRDEDTLEMTPLMGPDELVAAESIEEGDIRIASISHRGNVREINEDQYAVVRRNRTVMVMASSLADEQFAAGEEVTWLLLVADGMGGHAAGEVASEAAIRAVLEFGNELSSWIMRATGFETDEMRSRVDEYAGVIQRELQEQTEFDPRLTGMGTTLTAAYLSGSNAIVVNLGDSRSYLIRSNEIKQITHDHTVAQEMQDLGQDSATTQPYRHILTRCFSAAAEPVNMDLFRLSLAAEDQLLLCTDGLTDMVTDQQILRVINSAPSARDATEQLVRAALNSGGRDNITVILARPQQD